MLMQTFGGTNKEYYDIFDIGGFHWIRSESVQWLPFISLTDLNVAPFKEISNQFDKMFN